MPTSKTPPEAEPPVTEPTPTSGPAVVPPVSPEHPPFTEPVPNPPTGPKAERIIQDNIDAAKALGRDEVAAEYEDKLAASQEATANADNT